MAASWILPPRLAASSSICSQNFKPGLSAVMVLVLASLGFSTRPKASPSPAPEDVPPRLTYSTQVIGDTPSCGTFSACQSNCNAAYPRQTPHTFFKHI